MSCASTKRVRTDTLCQFAAGAVRVMTMATTIEEALRPLFVTCNVIGLGIYGRERPRPCLSALYSLTVWTAYGWLYCYIVISFKVESWFLTLSSVVKTKISILITVVTVINIIYYEKKFRMFLKRLAAVDDTLEELGTPKIYQKLHVRIKWTVIAWFVCSSIANVNDMMWWLYTLDDRRAMIIPYIVNHYRHVNMFMELSFVIFVWYIGTRFDRVNEHVRCLQMKEDLGLRCTWRKAVPATRLYIMPTGNYKRVLWTSMHLHLELCQIARELNVMYGLQITLEMISLLLFMTTLFHYLYTKMTRNRNVAPLHVWFDVNFWAIVYVARLFCLNYVCENVSAKANEIERIIHQLTDPLRYADIRDEIYQFTLQVIHHPLKFTGMGFFQFGYSFLQKFFLTIVTFVIIIVQMSIESYADP